MATLTLAPDRMRRLKVLEPVASAFDCCVLTVDLLWQESVGMVTAYAPERRLSRHKGAGEVEMDLRWAT